MAFMAMSNQFTQTGGLRYGDSFWYATNASIPFAEISVTQLTIDVTVRPLLRRWDRTFTFQRSAIQQLKWKRGFFSVGLHIVHTVSEYPPFLLFWSSNRSQLAKALQECGYDLTVNK